MLVSKPVSVHTHSLGSACELLPVLVVVSYRMFCHTKWLCKDKQAGTTRRTTATMATATAAERSTKMLSIKVEDNKRQRQQTQDAKPLNCPRQPGKCVLITR